jgi:hypothetical protein
MGPERTSGPSCFDTVPPERTSDARFGFPLEGDTSMNRKRFSTEQIVAVLKQAELGLPGTILVRLAVRPHSEVTSRRWFKRVLIWRYGTTKVMRFTTAFCNPMMHGKYLAPSLPTTAGFAPMASAHSIRRDRAGRIFRQLPGSRCEKPGSQWTKYDPYAERPLDCRRHITYSLDEKLIRLFC